MVIVEIIAAVIFCTVMLYTLLNALAIVAVVAIAVWGITEVEGLFYTVVASLTSDKDSRPNRAIPADGAKTSVRIAAEAVQYSIKNIN